MPQIRKVVDKEFRNSELFVERLSLDTFKLFED